MSTVYVDHGRAWCTVAGGFIANFLLGGLAKSYGLIMESFQEVFQSGTMYLLLAGGLIYTLMYCFSLAIHYISERYGSRPVVVAGALGSCLSLLVAAFSPNIALWVVAVGIGVGTSLSCIYFTVFSVVGRCFRRYLGLANGISVAGVSVGQMAFPALLTYLNDVYGTRGGTVVMSAICLHLLITAALMPRHIREWPPENDTKMPRRQLKDAPAKSRAHPTKADRMIASGAAGGDTRRVDGSLNDLYTELLKDPNNSPSNRLEKRTASSNDVQRTSLNKPTYVSLLSLNRRYDESLCRALLAVYIVAKVFGDIGDVSVSFVAPAHGTKLGLDPITVSRAIAVSGAVDLVARVGIGLLTDRPCCSGRRGILLASVWIVTGLNAIWFASLKPAEQNQAPPTSLLVGFYVGFAIHGVCSGTAMTQMLVVLSDWVGPSQLSHSLAITMVVLGILISPGQFAIGYVADTTHSFVWPLRICLIILVLAGLLLLMEFPVRWLFAQRRRRHHLAHLHRSNGHASELGAGHHDGSVIDVSESDSTEDQMVDTAGAAAAVHGLPQPGIVPVPPHVLLPCSVSLDKFPSQPFDTVDANGLVLPVTTRNAVV